MNISFKIELIIERSRDIRSLFVVYKCMTTDMTVQYVGVSKLIDLFGLETAVMNTKWDEIFVERQHALYLEVVEIWKEEVDAQKHARQLIDQLRPYMNIKGYTNDPRRAKVICHETGTVFDNAKEAAATFGISHSALINHLNGKIGYKTCKGYTFSRRG